MRLRTFRVPFSKVVGDDATELEFGPDDYLVVRPLFTLSRDEIQEWEHRIRATEDAAVKAVELPAGHKDRIAAEEMADRLIVDVIGRACLEWHLEGPDGEPIPQPGTPAALNALPGGLVAALYPFLRSYRGEAPNPGTPRSPN